MAGRRG
ncbi:ribosomal RNA large subunit methyltransferase H, partial [Yersinia pestis PY-36]